MFPSTSIFSAAIIRKTYAAPEAMVYSFCTQKKRIVNPELQQVGTDNQRPGTNATGNIRPVGTVCTISRGNGLGANTIHQGMVGYRVIAMHIADDIVNEIGLTTPRSIFMEVSIACGLHQ